MSIFMIGGIPCAGKSHLVRELIKSFPEHEDCEPMPLFRCQSHGDILIVGRYPENETFGGTDKLSYGTIPKFRDFIKQEEPKWKHIIIEGDRFYNMRILEDIVASEYESKIYLLQVSHDLEKSRHLQRQDTQGKVWLQSRKTLCDRLLTNFELSPHILIRDTTVDNVKEEILKALDI